MEADFKFFNSIFETGIVIDDTTETQELREDNTTKNMGRVTTSKIEVGSCICGFSI